ncbi:hypothetical protein M0802_016638 [Mischocyttarus mexicanus]|nr:hypothetical protein M0802_016638 [Mischocyttarus mexicanus]
MVRHWKNECGQPPRFQCPYCKLRSKQACNVKTHIKTKHPDLLMMDSFLSFVNPASGGGVVGGGGCGDPTTSCQGGGPSGGLGVGSTTTGLSCNEMTTVTTTTIIREQQQQQQQQRQQQQQQQQQQLQQLQLPPKQLYYCSKCLHGFTLKSNRNRHFRYECGHEPRFKCPYCELRSKQTSQIYCHIRKKHPMERVYVIDLKS